MIIKKVGTEKKNLDRNIRSVIMIGFFIGVSIGVIFGFSIASLMCATGK